MVGRLRRASGAAERHTADEGPFVSFTDLFIGILFLFLILVAALMLMHEEAVRDATAETQTMSGQVQKLQAGREDTVRDAKTEVRKMSVRIHELQAKVDAVAKRDTEHPAFRLAMVYNVYQAQAADDADWTYSRTVQLYRSPNDLCLENVILRNNLNLAWKPPVRPQDIPTAADQDLARMGTPCTITASGERWNLVSETGSVQRISPDTYAGISVLHKRDGNELVYIQYRILGIYDDDFRDPKGA